ncbi:MAG: branched-chain amino acid transaminase [Candidatus Aminicenantales bacterium]
MFDNTHFPKAKKYWYMGKIHDWSEHIIHPMSHALHYGSCVFEGIRAYPTSRGAAVFRLPEHIERFFHSASVLRMEIPYSKKEIMEAIKIVIRENELDSAYIRPLLFYSYGNLGLVPKICPVELIIAGWEWGAYLGQGTEKGAKVCIVSWRRTHHSQFDMGAKIGGLYAQSTIAAMYARRKGYDEAVFLNLEGNIAEGPGENIFIVKNGVVITNDSNESILEGITRTSILEIAEGLGYETKIAPITKDDFLGADEAFFTGTAAEIAPIVCITDGSDPEKEKKEYVVGTGRPGTVTLHLSQAYRDIVRGKIKDYEKWLSFVHD